MIVYPAALVLSAVMPLTNARIGYQTYTKDKTGTSVVVSSESVTGARDNPLRNDTVEYWEPTALPATWQFDFGGLSPIDYVGIAGHNIGTALNTVGVFIGEDTNFDARLVVTPVTGNGATTPDSAALGITGDIDIRVKAALVDWTPAAATGLIAHDGGGANRAWTLFVQTNGFLRFRFTQDGTTFTNVDPTIAPSTVDNVATWLRVTRVSSTGTVTFYTSADGVVWTQLGTPIVAVTGAMFNSTGLLWIGTSTAAAFELNGIVYYADVRNVIDGPTPVAKFDPSQGLTDAASFVSSTGETWTINRTGLTPARLINPRFSSGDISPVDNAPIMFLDIPRTARYMQIKLTGTGSVMPRIAVVYAGVALAMQRAMYGGHTPISLSRQTQLKQPVSRGGQFLGQSYRRLGVATSAAWKNLGAAWYRTNFDPFVKEARKNPYFFAWRPQSYPLELGYVWTGDDIAPSNMGVRDFMEVSMKLAGIGYE